MRNNKILYALLCLAMTLTSCDKTDILDPNENKPTANNLIGFEMSCDWTKMTDIAGIEDVPEQEVYAYQITGKEWGDASLQGSELFPYFTSDIIDPFILTRNGEAGSYTWSYEGVARFWPLDLTKKISFVTFAPQGEIAPSLQEGSGLPKFTYELSPVAENNCDVVADAKLNQISSDTENTDGCVDFKLEHILSKITFEANTNGINPNDKLVSNGGTVNQGGKVEYKITGILFYDIESKGELKIENDGSFNWDYQEDTDIVINATVGHALKDTPLSATSASVMADNCAVFVMPQDFTSQAVAVRVARTVTYPTGSKYANEETLYSTEKILVPATNGEKAWTMGRHYNYTFTFNIDKLDEYKTPMSVVSSIRPWVETDLDIQINRNIYTYTSNPNMEVDSKANAAEFTICTNYINDLRVPYQREELDGAITTARGFLFYSSEFTNDGSEVCYQPEKVSESGNTIYFKVSVGANTPNIENKFKDFTFTFSVKKSDRKTEGLYVSSEFNKDDAYGVNKLESDPVYIMTLGIDDNQFNSLLNNNFALEIGVEMISNGGGMIENKFPVKVIRK